MYLKSIEVNGFKAFANRIDFKFEEGITAIVGPNGSGKSNVGDAVRWVLGEQSASKLRGSKMEDVIFAGTQTRKPSAAAYVAITLDNSDHVLPIDFNEVTVARRVYRTGESEYLINGTVSRLKDVAALFFDTGIGKEGYSIIGQGQVERIVSDKPDERRALFDEAAGIVKYKKNKQLTEKQLEAQHVNLNRVNDIIMGLEERIEPLRQQSEKAKIYLDLKDRQKTLDINSFLLEVDKIRGKLDEKKKNLEITESDAEKLREEFDYTKAEYERLEESLEELNQKISASQLLINEKRIENERADGEIRVINERISSEDAITAEINLQIGRIKDKIEELDKQKANLGELKDQADEVFKKEQENADNIRELVKKAEDSEKAVAEKIENAKTDIVEYINKGGSLKEKIARYDAMLENINLRKTELNSRYLSDKSEQSQLLSDKTTYEEELSSVNESLQKDRQRLSKCESELRSVSDRSTTVKNEIQKYSQNVVSLQSRYESIRNLIERYDGYGPSIRKVMEKKSHNNKVIGVVADIISVDKEYETAIETALGASIQNIVTEDENTAKEMISYLRTNKLGRATFLPITSVVKRGGANPDALREPGVIGVASVLVKTDKKYQNIIESLLGRSIVVDNIDNAIKISKKYNQSLRLVTPTGELINPGGAMTGGAFKNSSNLLGRKRELEDIQKEIGDTNNKLRKAREEDANLTMKRETLREERNNLNSLINKLAIDQNSVTMNLSNVNQKLEEIDKSFVSIKKENEQLEEQTKQINGNKQQIFDTEKEHEGVVADRRALITELEKELQDKRDKKHQEEDNLSNATIGLENCRNRVERLAEDIDRIQNDIKQYEDEIKEHNSRLGSNSETVKSLEKELKDHEQNKIKNADIISKENEKLNSLIQEKEDINKNHKDFFGKREKLSSEINGLEKAAYSLKLDIEKLEEEKDKSSNYMWEEYELTYSKAETMKDPELSDPVALKKELNAVKQKIRSLGEVNVNSIEEFKEVSERYDFLKGQHDDIIAAEENLKGVIANLDKAMKETFAEKFKDIQVTFNKVFKELFGGGTASLTLVDEEDLLETGIIINAQPPGKKLQNMMQLSGGEKSLTAIALLFAIQSLKPSPFCLLDEIESALDDSNVSRFAKYLDRLTKHTQFIVITHRKGTMECANRLYGITMQEKGVSTLVSVNMIEDKLDA